MPSIARLILVGAALVALPGCVVGGLGEPPKTIAARIPISGGGSVEFMFTRDGPVHAETDDFRIEKSVLQISPAGRMGTYEFALAEKAAQNLKSIEVEDVSDESPMILMKAHVAVLKSEHWDQRTVPFPISPATTSWLYDVDNSIRVYRFTIETDGHQKFVIYEASAYPAVFKAAILRTMDIAADPR